jgi:hypothetical protein
VGLPEAAPRGGVDARHDEDTTPGPSRGSPELDAAEIEGQYFDPTSGLTFLHRAYKRLSTQREEVLPHVLTGFEKHQPLTSAGDVPFVVEGEVGIRMPDESMAHDMMFYYFDTCVVTYRMFHRLTTEAWLDVMLANARRGAHPAMGLGHPKTAIVLSIMAIVTYRRRKAGSHLVSGDAETHRLRLSDHYFCAAVQLTDAETGMPRLESAQARLVQVLYLLQTTRMNQAWYVFGVTTQILAALGLHRRSGKKRKRADYITLELRKRVFWVAYTIDIYLSVVFGRPRHFHDDDIDVEFPASVNDEQMTPEGPLNADPQDDCHIDALICHAK